MGYHIRESKLTVFQVSIDQLNRLYDSQHGQHLAGDREKNCCPDIALYGRSCQKDAINKGM